MPTPSIDPLGQALLIIARNAIGDRFGVAGRSYPPLPRLAEAGATFVTLTQQGELRGCIGSLEAYRALADDVAQNALAAAFRDPRFAPLTSGELVRTRVEVSLLAAAQAIAFADEADAIARLRPGIDGVILSHGARRATFLPQVWETLPEPPTFLARLKQKAGLPADFWDAAIRLERYSVQKWQEE